MTQIFLGYPPEHIKNWIIEHSKPAGNPKTKITFKNDDVVEVVEYDWSGEITKQTMIDAGLYNGNAHVWIKKPQTIEIGTNVTSIGDYVFDWCDELTSVTIPASVTSIGSGAFYQCQYIKNITIPASVTSIGNEAFSYCGSLTSVTIGDGIKSIGERAFEYCIALTSIIFSGKDKATVHRMGHESWGLKTGCVIHCTDGDIKI